MPILFQPLLKGILATFMFDTNVRDETYSFLDNASANVQREEVKKRAYHDVEELETTIREIKTTFVEVDGSLAGFDKAGFRDKDQKDLQFGQEWKEKMRASLTFFDAYPN
jgi:CRISPR/Cas system CMR subunit Cmr6 (Cas7 group RAMP superfamily)